MLFFEVVLDLIKAKLIKKQLLNQVQSLDQVK